ncbi:pyridoxamine 5'-phosphate oxidase [Solimonas soli]|uniref:pyridoxamine 5'-phosphate oxidase n=1 Tax=Solimonas soli TaxID=413479 RepID=UPI00048682E9|nr:pyridoxamine 5'-phosphate oxidase [Solimonas soli]
MPQYTQNPPLDIADLDADPLAQLQRWLDDAGAAGMIEPTAMTVATVDAQGRPSARIVLFKGFHGEGFERGLTFFTNYDSRKGRDLAANPHVALVFWWDKVERSVRIEGRAAKLPREVSERYFHSRPHDSQVGAVTSRQSAVVRSREALDQRYAEQLAHYEGRGVPLPEFWGGYRVAPEAVEFWQGRHGRLHDRLRYRREGDGWLVERLEP